MRTGVPHCRGPRVAQILPNAIALAHCRLWVAGFESLPRSCKCHAGHPARIEQQGKCFYAPVWKLRSVAPDQGSNVEADLASCMRPLAEQLPPKYRDTLLATDFEHRPMKDLADREGLSLSAVKSRAARARALLRSQLTRCCQIEFEDGAVTSVVARPDGDCCQ